MSTLSRRMQREEGLEVACCDEEGGAMMFGKFTAIGPTDGGKSASTMSLVTAVDDGNGDEVRSLDLRGARSRWRRLFSISKKSQCVL